VPFLRCLASAAKQASSLCCRGNLLARDTRGFVTHTLAGKAYLEHMQAKPPFRNQAVMASCLCGSHTMARSAGCAACDTLQSLMLSLLSLLLSYLLC